LLCFAAWFLRPPGVSGSAEKPRLYLPRWSDELLQETQRAQLGDLGWPPHLAKSFQTALRTAFPEALVTDYEHLIDRCANDPKDRHVLACAAQSQAELIMTFNLRDFPTEALQPWRKIKDGFSSLHKRVREQRRAAKSLKRANSPPRFW
jgi:hypothetical protein